MAKAKAKTSADTAANLGFEAKLWLTADKLRNNMDAAEYKHVVLGLIFLKYISDALGYETQLLRSKDRLCSWRMSGTALAAGILHFRNCCRARFAWPRPNGWWRTPDDQDSSAPPGNAVKDSRKPRSLAVFDRGAVVAISRWFAEGAPPERG